MKGFTAYGGRWVLAYQCPRAFFTDDDSRRSAALAEHRPAGFRAMRVAGQEVHALVTEKNIGASLRGGPEFSGHAHGGDLNENAVFDKSSDDGRITLDLGVALGVD